MIGEYNIRVLPDNGKAWRNAKTLRAELTLDVDGKQRKYSGTLIKM